MAPGRATARLGFLLTNLPTKAKGVVHFYNHCGAVEHWIKEGKYVLSCTKLPCRRFVANQVRLQLLILAYNLRTSCHRLGLPETVKDWSSRSIHVKLIGMGGRLVRHAGRLPSN